MKVAIMQPYLFPYLGYWQLIKSVDTFVILDDVNFIKSGYINRNNILVNNQSHMFTIPVDKPSQNKLIMDTKFKLSGKIKEKLLRMIYLSYKKAKCFEDVYGMLEDIILFDEDDLTTYIEHSLLEISEYLEVCTQFKRSSAINIGCNVKGEQRIIEKCKAIGANTYINPIGGVSLYSRERFLRENIELYFIQMKKNKIDYKQFDNDFIENLSIIDVLMFNKKSEILDMLDCYELIQN